MTQLKWTVLLAMGGALSFQPLARAADTQEPAKPAAGQHAAAVRERLQQLATDLKLTDQQQESVQTIVRDRLEKLRELRQDTSLSQAEKMEKFKALREELVTEVKKVLTPEQLDKWKEKSDRFLSPAQGPMERLQESIKQLHLTDEQKAKLKPLYEQQMEKLRGLRQDASLTLQDKLEKLVAMRKEIAPEIKKVLDPAQFEQWQKSLDGWLDGLKQRFQGQNQQ